MRRSCATFSSFVDPPYGVALDNGRPKAVVSTFDDSEPARTLRSIGYVQ